MKNYENLSFWEESHQLAIDIYEITKGFPKSELYGLTSQLRRSALSVPTNIAEGCGRESKKELRRYLVMASGSIVEVEYLLLFCKDMVLITEPIYVDLTEKASSIKKRLTAYKNKIC